jgi:uncharacterized protein YgfB (UPF0149 family)
MLFLGLLPEDTELDYKSVQKFVSSIQQDRNAGELHGLICGYLAAGSRPSALDWPAILESWFETPALPADGVHELLPLSAMTLDQLNDQELSFSLLLPDDDQPMENRLEAVSCWCRGFLHGFGLAGNYQQQDLSEDASELLADIAEISKMSVVGNEDDTEEDFVEILEYLRVGAMILFTEHGQRDAH